MTSPPRSKKASYLRPSDLRGIAQLATQATSGVARITEGVHQSVWSTLGVSGKGPGQTGGLTGLIYQSVQGITRGVGKGLDLALGAIEPLLAQAPGAAAPASPQREAVIAALNGVMGDRLAAGNSPFATPMSVRHHGEALALDAPLVIPGAGPKMLLMVHGLCMNDLQWCTGQGEAAHDHGQALAAALGYTAVYLRYNTGLHTSQNGHELARRLEQLVTRWPQPVQELSVLVHSMGGLVIRSAVQSARQSALRWPAHLKHIVFLGTPHHGAPLERAGHGVDLILGGTPWTQPFTRLARLRSAGITDLRHGHVLDEDWQGHDRFERHADTRRPLPLPDGVACHTVAATTAAKRGALADRLIGDGLVPLHSALGIHPDPRHGLAFAEASQFIAYKTGHMALLSSPAVAEQVQRWLSGSPQR